MTDESDGPTTSRGTAARWRRLVRSAHRWLGLILFAQVLLWIASGVVMSWFPIEQVRGETAALQTFPIELQPRGYASPGGVIAQSDGAAEVRLRVQHGRPVYDVRGQAGRRLFDAETGAPLPPVTEADARRIASADFIGDGEIVAVERLTTAPLEYRGPLPAWRVSFDDREQSRLYISEDIGAVEARRNRIWRLYDFFWMLHIMDYQDRTDFNNPLVRAASATALLFAITGLMLVLDQLIAGRYLRAVRGGVGPGARRAYRQE